MNERTGEETKNEEKHQGIYPLTVKNAVILIVAENSALYGLCCADVFLQRSSESARPLVL